MVGQLGQVRPRIGGIHGLQGLPHAAVQTHPAGRRQVLIHHLADQRVGEAPAAEPTGDRTDDPGRLRLLQQPKQPLAVQAANRLQHAQPEIAADHGGDLQDPPAALGQAAEPLGDDRLDPLRQACRQRRARLARAEPALAGEQADDLGDEERVAVGLLVYRRRQPRRWLHPGDQRDKARHLALVQPAKQQPAAALPPGQVSQRRQQRMLRTQLAVPVNAHYQQARIFQLAARKPQQGQRRRVGPVQVIQYQQQRPPFGRRPQEAGQAVEQPEPGRLRLGRQRCRQVRQQVPDRRDHLGDVGSAGAQVVAQRRRIAGLDVGADDLNPRPERGRALPLPAAAPQHKGTARGRLGRQLLSQPGLADARLPGQQHHPATAHGGRVQVGGECGQLRLAAHKRCRHSGYLPSTL